MYGLILILLLLGLLVWASADISGGVYLKTLCRSKEKARVLAVTFDDGPSPMTGKVLDVLKAHDVRATFFLTGTQAEKYPDLVRRIMEEGHVIGNHTYSHSPFLPLRSGKRICAELEKTREILYRLTGKKVLLFRPPFGVTNPMVGYAARKSGHTAIGWSIRSFDTVSSRTRDEIWERVDRRLHPGGILLLHDRLPEADTLLHRILESAEKKDYTFETADHLLNINAYEK